MGRVYPATLRCVLLLAVLVFTMPALSQREGETTVSLRQYDPQLEVVEESRENFDVEAAASQRGMVGEVISRADAARRALNDSTGDALLIRIRIVLAPTQETFVQLVGGQMENSTAVSLKDRATIVMNGGALRAQGFEPLGRVLVHEFAHVYLDARCVGPVPRWLHEGVAQAVSGEWQTDGGGTLLITRLFGGLIPLRELEQRFPVEPERQELAYQQSSSLVQFIVREQHGGSLRHMLASIRGEDGRTALAQYWSVGKMRELEAQWRKSLVNWSDVPALLLNSSLVWGSGTLLLFLAYYIKRRRNRALRQEWAEEDQVYQVLDDARASGEVPHEWVDPEYEDEYDEEGNWKGRRELEP